MQEILKENLDEFILINDLTEEDRIWLTDKKIKQICEELIEKKND